MDHVEAMREQRFQAIGIDVGGTNLRAGLIDPAGNITSALSERVVLDREGFTRRVREIVAALDPSQTAPVGIGLPGRIDGQRNRPVSAGFLDIAELPLPDLLGCGKGRVVRLENDASMALRAEMAVGVARGFSDVALLTIGTGIGGACAVAGRPMQGHAFAGQFGHLTVHATGGLPCKCGRQGCVETTSSGTALGRLIGEAGLPDGTRAAALLRAAKAGDALATDILTRWAAPLRCAMETLIAAIDPDLIVLGGGLGADAFAALDLVPFQSAWFQCPVRAAVLGDDAGMIGAGLCALGYALTQPETITPC